MAPTTRTQAAQGQAGAATNPDPELIISHAGSETGETAAQGTSNTPRITQEERTKNELEIFLPRDEATKTVNNRLQLSTHVLFFDFCTGHAAQHGPYDEYRGAVVRRCDDQP